jgi:hypothetical protein
MRRSLSARLDRVHQQLQISGLFSTPPEKPPWTDEDTAAAMARRLEYMTEALERDPYSLEEYDPAFAAAWRASRGISERQ